jgi:hypothetical protein
VDPKDPKEPEKGEQQPEAPSEQPTEGGRATPDHWEELLEPAGGGSREGQEGSATHSNSEGEEETEFEF